MRMMIIEDEQRARRGLKGLLLATAEEQDEIVAEASNGKDGLELIKTLKPDVVFTDIEMPYINGLELIKNVRKEGPDQLSALGNRISCETVDYGRCRTGTRISKEENEKNRYEGKTEISG